MARKEGLTKHKILVASTSDELQNGLNEFEQEATDRDWETIATTVRVNPAIDEGFKDEWYAHVVYKTPIGKACPQCGNNLPVEARSHLKCGWKE